MFLRFINYKMKIVLIGEYSRSKCIIAWLRNTYVIDAYFQWTYWLRKINRKSNGDDKSAESWNRIAQRYEIINLTQIWADFDLKMIPIRHFNFFFRGLTFQRWKHKPPTTCKRGIDWTPTHNATKCWKCSKCRWSSWSTLKLNPHEQLVSFLGPFLYFITGIHKLIMRKETSWVISKIIKMHVFLWKLYPCNKNHIIPFVRSLRRGMHVSYAHIGSIGYMESPDQSYNMGYYRWWDRLWKKPSQIFENTEKNWIHFPTVSNV